MLYIRADGNTEIGMGHVMRCLSVAEAAADIAPACPPVFITADEGCRAMIEDRGFRVIVLHTDYRDMMGELPAIERVLREQPDKDRPAVLVDSYQAGTAYYLALQKLAKVACFEDMGQIYPVDLLINYNIYAPALEGQYIGQTNKRDKKPNQEWHIEQNMESCAKGQYPRKILLGTSYTPLRKTFQEAAEYVVRDKVTDVTITTGGSDPYLAAGALADTLCSDGMITEGDIHLHIISGPFNRFADELKRRYQCNIVQEWQGHKIARSDGGKLPVTIHENVKDMQSLLLQSDVVITATGSTIYEVSSIGVPMIVFYFAENQRQGAEAVGRLTDIVNAGCFAAEPDAVAYGVREALKRCITNKEYRELLYSQERALIDGKGARRIAEHLMAVSETEMREEHDSRKKETTEL